MSILKQRVALGSVNGSDVYITLEWLKDLQKIESGDTTATSTVTSDDLLALQTGLTALITALALRVTKLEGGYQV